MKKTLGMLLALGLTLSGNLWADGTPVNPQQVSMWGNLAMLAGFIAIFYFLIWRPQSKRAKEHRSLIGGLEKGSEVVTSGGIIGRVTKVQDEFLVIEVADKVELPVQKTAVAAELPKGTLKAIKA
jgi:preprotein translocase subunit YajC